MNTIKKLKGYRAMADLTQREMGKLINKSPVAYHYKEIGKNHFTDEEKELIYKVISQKLPKIKITDLFE